ncbi:MAG: hypothetical protein KGJ23_08765 [Euryarchaeota archaeon]|nr:hypothetical protein [Euryarchaeota archaeon]MDE1836695.1 hypothetical protein [Euryarchaeota archaeon]MDE1880276.1 hypothetical protein [Euryarchaeota archaeon]MDE2044665.1 hypothetical protein [Thermoplasmata archaeon]
MVETQHHPEADLRAENEELKSCLEDMLRHLGYNYPLSTVKEACRLLGFDPLAVSREWHDAEQEQRPMDFDRVRGGPR